MGHRTQIAALPYTDALQSIFDPLRMHSLD
jgi:hypothetical protein